MIVSIDNMAWLPKSGLAPANIEKIKEDLTIIPRKFGNEQAEPIILYSESDTHLGVPPSYFFRSKNLSLYEIDWKASEGDKSTWPGDLTFAPDRILREEQERAVKAVIKSFDSTPGGTVEAVPGFGKTVVACAVIARMQIPTLVVVHKEFLMDQWEERLKEYLPGVKIGKAQANKCDYLGKHVVLGMVHSLGKFRYGPVFRAWPGLLIVDETHRIGAQTFAPVPLWSPARYRIGLSGTLRRKDGAENVFWYTLGSRVFTSSEQRLTPKIKRVFTDFKVNNYASLNTSMIKYSLVTKFLCASKKRNEIIIDYLIQALKAGRKVLFLSHRIPHLKEMQNLLLKSWSKDTPKPTTDFYIGGKTAEALHEASQAQCLFATVQLVTEGLDIPQLDTLFLTTPMSDIIQAAGRILRPFEGKKEPIIVDFRDDSVPLLKNAGKSREKQYINRGWFQDELVSKE